MYVHQHLHTPSRLPPATPKHQNTQYTKCHRDRHLYRHTTPPPRVLWPPPDRTRCFPRWTPRREQAPPTQGQASASTIGCSDPSDGKKKKRKAVVPRNGEKVKQQNKHRIFNFGRRAPKKKRKTWDVGLDVTWDVGLKAKVTCASHSSHSSQVDAPTLFHSRMLHTWNNYIQLSCSFSHLGVDSIQKHGSFVGVVEALEEIHHRGFACTGRPDLRTAQVSHKFHRRDK